MHLLLVILMLTSCSCMCQSQIHTTYLQTKTVDCSASELLASLVKMGLKSNDIYTENMKWM